MIVDVSEKLCWAKGKLNEGIPCHQLNQSSEDDQNDSNDAKTMLKIECIPENPQFEIDKYFAKILTTTYTKNYSEHLICQVNK